MTRAKSKSQSRPKITETERYLRQLEQRMREQIGTMERIRTFDEDEKGRIIKLIEHFLEATSGSVRDEAIRYFVLDRLKFVYRYG